MRKEVAYTGKKVVRSNKGFSRRKTTWQQYIPLKVADKREAKRNINGRSRLERKFTQRQDRTISRRSIRRERTERGGEARKHLVDSMTAFYAPCPKKKKKTERQGRTRVQR